MVDVEDYERLSIWNWTTDWKGYVRRGRRVGDKMITVLMHRELIDCPDGMQIDHINGNKSDNRKANLRLCTPRQNMTNQKRRRNNTSGYKGVSEIRPGRFQVSIDNKVIGWFRDAIEAAKAYDNAAVKLHGEFAVLNFPNEQK